VRVEINLCVYKLHFACKNHTRKCQNYTRVCGNHTQRLQSHSAGGNCTLRVEITLERAEITLVRFEITLVRIVIADLFFAFLGGLITPSPSSPPPSQGFQL
jgi:hypothetical protein